MTKISLISDTHSFLPFLDQSILNKIKGSEYIIHAGDHINEGVINELREYGIYYGVAGNNDPWSIVDMLGRKKIITIDGIRIGICHGDGYYFSAFANARTIFQKEDVKLIVYGHSHVPSIKEENDQIYVCPGSPSQPRRGSKKTIGMMSINDGKIGVDLIEI